MTHTTFAKAQTTSMMKSRIYFLFTNLLSHFPQVRHHSSSSIPWRYRYISGQVMRDRLNRERRNDRQTKDARHRNSCFHSQIAQPSSSSLYFHRWWCCICSCKNRLGFLFEFYDLNRILRNIFPPLPRSRRRNRVSSWFYALFLWLYVWQPLLFPSGILMAAAAICSG